MHGHVDFDLGPVRLLERAASSFPSTMKKALWLIGAACVLVMVVVGGRRWNSSTFEPPQRQGAPTLITAGSTQALWLVTKQEEQRPLWGGGRGMNRFWRETFYHFDLTAFDPLTASPTWKKRLRTVRGVNDGHSSQSRILGQEGDVVWLFVHDQPVAVSSGDGAELADREALSRYNPDLNELLPQSLDYHAFDRGLVITAADARRFKVRLPDYKLLPYSPHSEEHFSQLQFMAARWNGGFNTADFLTRQVSFGERWFGLMSPKEAADTKQDGFGENYKSSSRWIDEGPRARRSFWEAKIGRTKDFSEGTHPRIADLTQMPDSREYLQGGLLVKAGTRRPLTLESPAGLILIHRTRLDEQGRLALVRLDHHFRKVWETKLPFSELQSRWEWPDRLLMYGPVQRTERGVMRWQEILAAVNLADGSLRTWNVTRETDLLRSES